MHPVTGLLGHLRRNAVAYLALFVALGGTSYAAVKLPRNSVGAKQIRAKAVGRSELGPKVRKALGKTGARGPAGAAGPATPSVTTILEAGNDPNNLPSGLTAPLAPKAGYPAQLTVPFNARVLVNGQAGISRTNTEFREIGSCTLTLTGAGQLVRRTVFAPGSDLALVDLSGAIDVPAGTYGTTLVCSNGSINGDGSVSAVEVALTAIPR